MVMERAIENDWMDKGEDMTEYQKIDFGDVKIDGKDRFPEYKLVFPEPPVNKVILDVGCNLGYYCFKAHMEGAKQCVGIDNHSAFIESANNTKKMNSIADGAVDFVLGDIATYPFGKFHYVLLLYVLHHFKDIKTVAGVISKCYALAKECLVIGILDWPNDCSAAQRRTITLYI